LLVQGRGVIQQRTGACLSHIILFDYLTNMTGIYFLYLMVMV
jgi:hypothetical protein